MSSNKTVRLDDIMDVMVEKLNSGGVVTFTPNGTSMLPMLRDGEDVVVLKSVQGRRLHLFDVPLYRRDNGQYVLHRVIDFTRDGSYVMCGDNQFAREKGIRDDQIIAVMTGFFRKGKPYTTQSFSYRVYINFWYYTRPFRRAYRFGRRKASKLIGKQNKTTAPDSGQKDSTAAD